MAYHKWIKCVGQYWIFQPMDQLGEAWGLQILSQRPPAKNSLACVLAAQIVSFPMCYDMKNARQPWKVKHLVSAWHLVSFKPEAAVIIARRRGGGWEAVLMATEASVGATDRRIPPPPSSFKKTLLDALLVSSL